MVNGKLWNSYFRPEFPKSWIYQIVHVKYWIINDPTIDAFRLSEVFIYKQTRNHGYISSAPIINLLEKNLEKSGDISY